MNTNNQECLHTTMGQSIFEGSPDHRHQHPHGSQICFDCGLTIQEIITKAISQAKREELEEVKKEIFNKMRIRDWYHSSKTQDQPRGVVECIDILKEVLDSRLTKLEANRRKGK